MTNSVFDLFLDWGGEIESSHSAPAGMSMAVGVYVGLVLGTMDPAVGGPLRRRFEVEMGRAMDRSPESLEAEVRSLIAAHYAQRGAER